MLTAPKWIGIVLGALALAIVLLLAFIDWNRLGGRSNPSRATPWATPSRSGAISTSTLSRHPALPPTISGWAIRTGRPHPTWRPWTISNAVGD